MPLTSAIQSAMAIRNERERREQRRLSKIRRESGRPSMDAEIEIAIAPKESDSSSVTTFHLGVVFILLGFIMIFSSMIPSSIIDADWSRLFGVGVSFIFIGLMMVMVNRIITAREEEELSRYVKQRLSRTRSGHPFVRDSDAEQPQPLPSALKKSWQGPSPSPKSPKDKVTFAEFKNEVFSEDENNVPRKLSVPPDLTGILKESGIVENGTKNVPTVTLTDTSELDKEDNSLSKDRLSPITEAQSVPFINICEPSSESHIDSDLDEPEPDDFKGTLESMNGDNGDIFSPTNETQRLLPDPEDLVVGRQKIY